MTSTSVRSALNIGRFAAGATFLIQAVGVLMVALISMGSPLQAQDNAADSSTASTKPLQSVSVTTNGISRYQPGQWGTLGIDVINRGSDTATVESAAWIGGHENDQFGRSVWVPAEGRRTTWTPIFIPPQSPKTDDPVLYWMGVRKTHEGEVFSTPRNQSRFESRQLIVPKSNSVFAVITDYEDESCLNKSDLLSHLMKQAQPDSTVLTFPETQLPVVPEALGAVRVLVVMGEKLAHNSLAVEAVQEWTRRGGSLWLMLDTMSYESARTICGGDLSFQEIDRISLTSYSLITKTNSEAMQRSDDEVELTRPVQLVRVFTEQGTILATAQDWPAAVMTSFGQGRILCSTLGLDGFFVPRSSLQSENTVSSDRQVWSTTAGQELLSKLGSTGAGKPVHAETMTEYVTGKIGYQLPDRSAGAIVLAVFCFTLAVICVVIHRSQKPVFLLPSVGILAAVSAFAFFQMAAVSQSPADSAVTFQILESSGEQDKLILTGMAAFHSQSSSQPTIQSTSAGMLRFDGPVNPGIPVRMLWSDQNVWQLQNAKLAAGVRLAEFRQSIDVQNPAVVKATFNESGFVGRLTGNISTNWTDAVVADLSGFALPVSIDHEGDVFSSTRPLPPGQHLDSTILNAEQSRRQKVYRQIFDASQRNRAYPSQPTLMAWSGPLKLKTGRVDDDKITGAMLAAFPVIIERPEPGARIRVPSTFLPYRSVKNRKLKIGFASTFSNSRRTWSTNTSSNASTSLLRFEIPAELMPLVVGEATLTLKISAPLREVVISSGHPDSLQDVWSESSPVGTFDVALSSPQSRRLDDDGTLHVALKVGAVQLDELSQADMGTEDRHWQVEWIQLEIQGLIQ